MFSDPISYVMVCISVVVLIGCFHGWRSLDRDYAERKRQWIQDVNELAAQYGHPGLAGTPDNPDAAYVKCFDADQTPAQVISSVFGSQQPITERKTS